MLFKRKKNSVSEYTLESLLKIVDLNYESKIFKEDGGLNRRGRLLLKKTANLIELIENCPFFFKDIYSLKEYCWNTFGTQYAGKPLEICENVLLHFKKIGDNETSVYENKSNDSNTYNLTKFGEVLLERFKKWCENMKELNISPTCDDFDKKVSEILKYD